MIARLNPASLGRSFQWEGRPGSVVGARTTKRGALHLIVRFDDGEEKAFTPSREDIAPPTHFRIRRKDYDFAAAPALTEPDAYVAASIRDGRIIEGGRFAVALDAAREAARLDHGRDIGERGAVVRCDHSGPRPAGAMKGWAYVSYQPRWSDES